MLIGSNKKFKLRQIDRQVLLGLKSWIIDKVRKPSKKRLSFSWKKKRTDDDIEILDVDEKESYAKTRFKLPKIRSKRKFAIGTVAALVLSIFTLLIIPCQNIIKTGAKKFLDSLGIYTQEIKSVEIQSNDYNNPGSWHINKSAEWIGLNKAQVTFDVNSVMKISDNYKDIILVIDTSGSMYGNKFQKAISDSKELINYVLSDTSNRVAIITFSDESSIVSEFSNDRETLLSKLNSLKVTGNTNYNIALKNVDTIMNSYVQASNRNVTALFLTDGYPNRSTPNEVGTYAILKEKYPYMAINGIQYEMGKQIIDEIKQITDSQWAADQSTLNNTLFEAALSPDKYVEFIVTDYIDEKFKVDSVNDIMATMGTVTLDEENGLQKIVWNLGKNLYVTGGNAKMYINLALKEEYTEKEGLFPTNNKEAIESKLSDEPAKIVNSTKTPVLKGMYEVIYDTNTPDGCTLPSISSEKYFIYQNVTKKTDKLTCDGYLFKGWEIDEEDEKNIVEVNDSVFQMPDHDVTIRATWARQSIVKSMNGTIYEKPTLYRVLRDTAREGIYAKEYTGAHNDSIDSSKSTEKIYHFYGSDDTNGTAILDKNNVIFAGHCWQMIRTTDTGGVKMIYNGEAENNQCLDTRGTHVGYNQLDNRSNAQYMSKSYYYGTDYNYDSTTKSFTLSGTITTGEIKTEQYTCRQTSADAMCTILYYVDPLSTNYSYYYVFPLNAKSHYSQFGILQFSRYTSSLSDVGYMYNTRYISQSKAIISAESVLLSSSLSTDYWYADEIEYNSSSTVYSLVNPYQVSSTADYSNLIGKYTFKSATETYTNSSVYYIVAVNDLTMYYIQLQSGNDLSYYNDTYTYGDSYTDNGDGTYTINNPATIEGKDWYTGYSNVKNKYVCKDVTATCNTLWYTLSSTSEKNIYYIKVNDVSNTYKYAKDFEYKIDPEDGTYKYFLKADSTVSFWDIANSANQESFNNAHYTCFNTAGKCTEISYVYYLNTTTAYYINIKDGKSVEDAKNEMLYNDDVNVKDSTIKMGVDLWYERYLLNYSAYLEDTVFCYDRSQNNASTNGWNPNGGSISTLMNFYGTNDLNCPNEMDRFSISNEKAKLKYKVGLISYGETRLLGNYKIRITGQYYWLGSPGTFQISTANVLSVHDNDKLSLRSVYHAYGLRPAISLKPGTEYVDGDGSMAHPYIVGTD